MKSVKIGNYNPLEFEPEILEFWKSKKIYENLKQKNKGKHPFFFLDGPPYTSGKVHIGTAWNKSLKDSIMRYKRMNGHDVWDRAGYDMHGLPTENATQKKLNLNSKKDIENFGVDNFIEECRQLCIDNMKIMNEDFKRLGIWMDFDNAYQSITHDFMESEWWLIKKTYDDGRLYEGLRSMSWDWVDQTALAKHELEYKKVTNRSIFVKMKVKKRIENDKKNNDNTHDNTHLVVWTTTPWTIAFNLAIMVNPEITYVKCEIETKEQDKEHWIVAKELANSFISGIAKKEFQIVEEFKGIELEGLEYEHPFYSELKEQYDKIKKNCPKTHTVVLSKEYVDTSAGTGLVHCAPGCGPEDYEVGHRNNILAWNTVKEDGYYSSDMGKFSGRHALKENKSFIEDLDASGALVAEMPYEHEYAFGERSHQPIIYRTTTQWFFKIEDLKDHMISENEKISWVPDAAFNAFESWLKNLRDNSVSKQRYWGTPIPIWKNIEDENDMIVIGSVKELEDLSGQKIQDLHMNTVDKIEIKKDGKTYRRIKDILDVWVDAGTGAWNSLNFPQNKELFEKFYPADFILEGKDQIRGWFNLLMVASTLAFKKTSFKACYMHGFVNDSLGRKMSKSLGNYILPEEVIKEYGADTLRYYTIGGANPGLDLNYNFEDMKIKYRNLSVLWNVHKYVIDYSKNLGINPARLDESQIQLDVEEQYLLSKMHSSIKKATDAFKDFKLNEVPLIIEDLFLDLSRNYMQLVREKSSSGSDEEKKAVLYAIYNVLSESLKMFATVSPFISEKMYLNMKEVFSLKDESIHHCSWPKYDIEKINSELEEDVNVVKKIIQSILNAREKISLGVRWPIKSVVVVSEFEEINLSVKRLEKVIMNHTNVKALEVSEEFENVKLKIKTDVKKLGPLLGKDLPKVLAHISLSSPQALMNYNKDGKIKLNVDGKDYEIPNDALIVEKELPEHLVESEFGSGSVVVDKTRTDELEAEGFARELMRRVQDSRKTGGLEKLDRIDLYIHTDEYIVEMVSSWRDQIALKVGAAKLEISSKSPSKDYKEKSSAKIKGKNVVVYFNKK